MPNGQMDKQLTQMAGEYLVAAHLCLSGYVAFLTWKNYPKVDVFCLNPNNNRQVPIQVKTTRGHNQYHIPEIVDAADPTYVFVRINPDNIQYYVVPAVTVAELSELERQEYLQAHPNAQAEQPRMLSVNRIENFQNRWDLLNLD